MINIFRSGCIDDGVESAEVLLAVVNAEFTLIGDEEFVSLGAPSTVDAA